MTEEKQERGEKIIEAMVESHGKAIEQSNPFDLWLYDDEFFAVLAYLKNEWEKIFREHNHLVLKLFDTGLTNEENLRLQDIRAEIDRIENMILGESLDRLESFLTEQKP